ncbi:ABC transporter ATP-binding protein [Microbispora sp. H10949]|uniref:ABC transporter ATP-binding protein n=1 Tax=Microbispora sp. H10949 TaxID=2729111 RepID=UPI001603626B|nr:ABC transporter ATP-binding protein [Microbispora sp. H10949]
MTGLEVEDLSVAYGGKAAVRGVSFTVAPGQTYGLVGESGCGKTTVGRALGGQVARGGAITSGRIGVDGVDVLGLPPAGLRRWRAAALAVVHQEASASLDPTMRVGTQLAQALRARGRDRREVPALLERVRLPDPRAIARRYPHQLSGGQQQRVVIAAALAARPRLLVLDEPTTGLDATVEREILELIGELRVELAAAVVLISHDLDLVGRLCDRVGVLYAGRLVEEGPAEAVLREPAHPYPAALLAGTPRLGRTRRTHPLTSIPGHPPVPGEELAGCPFAQRCPQADTVCHSTAPALSEAVPATADVPEPRAASGLVALHRVSCHHPGQARRPEPRPRPAQRQSAETEPAVPESGPLLEIRGLTRRYGRTVAVDGVDLVIRRGEVVGLVGESGSGKTTLARAVAGLAGPGPGTITLHGGPLHPSVTRRDPGQRRAVQMVFQNPYASLNPSHTVRTILARAARSLGGTRDPAVLAGEAGLDAHILDARPDRLSGGQRQRVAIARAFAGEPDLVVCDEPVSALDVSVQAGVLRLLDDRQRAAGTSYLFISHDLAVVGYLADRIAVMYQGRIVEQGPAGQVLHGPHHPYTALLVGSRRPGPPGRVSGTGCPFAGTCPSRIDGLCDTSAPPARDLGQEHVVRCHLDPGRLPRRAGTSTSP